MMLPSRCDLTRRATVLRQIPGCTELQAPLSGPAHNYGQLGPGQRAGVYVLIANPDAGAPLSCHGMEMRLVTIVLTRPQDNLDPTETAHYWHSA